MADSASFTLSQRIDAILAQHLMLDHPFYQAWSAGSLTRETLRDYAKQYFHHVEAFPRVVSAVHTHCPDRDGRRMLAENLAEEEGLGEGKTDHAGLWMQFAEGLGATADDVEGVALNPETRDLIDTFQSNAKSSYAAGLAALYAYETQLPSVAKTKIEGLEAFYGVNDAQTIRFFTVHEAADIEHAAVCRTLLDKLSPAEAEAAVMGAESQAKALLGFLTGMQRSTGMVC